MCETGLALYSGLGLTETLSGNSTHYDMEEKMDLHDLRGRLAKVNEDAEALVKDIQEMLALRKMPDSRAWTAMCNGMMMRYQDTIEANEEVMSKIDKHLISAGDCRPVRGSGQAALSPASEGPSRG